MNNLVYKAVANGDERRVQPERIGEPLPEGWILGELKSATICATDVTNLHDGLDHNRIASSLPGFPRGILGHECCFYVKRSNNSSVPAGKYIVTLGDDWLGFSERQTFFPVLSDTPTNAFVVKATDRNYWDPDPPAVRAVHVLDDWFPGASLIEPATHVYTAFRELRLTENNASVLVLGAGFCGQIACRIAKDNGAREVWVVDRDHDRVISAHARRNSADRGIAIQSPEGQELIRAKIKEVDRDPAGDVGFDVVFDALPGWQAQPNARESLLETRTQAAQLLRPGGRWVMYSAAARMELPSLLLVAKGIAICGAPYDHRRISFMRRARDMEHVCQRFRNELETFIGRSIPFCDEQRVCNAIEQYGTGAVTKVEILRYCTGTADSPDTCSGCATCTDCRETKWPQ